MALKYAISLHEIQNIPAIIWPRLKILSQKNGELCVSLLRDLEYMFNNSNRCLQWNSDNKEAYNVVNEVMLTTSVLSIYIRNCLQTASFKNSKTVSVLFTKTICKEIKLLNIKPSPIWISSKPVLQIRPFNCLA